MKKLFALLLVLALFASLGVTAWAAEGEETTGRGEPVARAAVVEALWDMAGQPVVNYALGFTDLDAEATYMDAVRWAAAEGIVNGYNAKTFGPNDPTTREQLAVMVYRYAQTLGLGFTGAWYFPLNYPDAADVSSWADEAMHWVVMNGLMEGRNGQLEPKRNVTQRGLRVLTSAFADLLNPGTVGISMPTNASDRWVTDGADLKEQFEAAGYKVLLQFTDSVSGDQDADVLDLIAQGADLLLIAAVDSDGLSRSLAEAKAQGIPVVAYDRMINGSDAVSAFITYDSYVVGKMQGECIRDALDLDNAAGPFNIEYAAGSPTDVNADYVFRGAMDVLKPYIDAGKLLTPSGETSFDAVATLHWRDEEACTRFTRILAEHYADGTRLDAVLCGSDNVAHGVGDALAAGYTASNKPVLTGQDANPDALLAIADGRQTMTVYKDFAAQAAVAFAVSEALLEGKTLGADLAVAAAFDGETYHNDVMAVPTYLLTPDLITAENVEQYRGDDFELAEMILGRWMLTERGGEYLTTNEKTIYNFITSDKAYLSASFEKNAQEEARWIPFDVFDVSISGSTIILTGSPDAKSTLKHELTVTDINENEFTANNKVSVVVDGNEVFSFEMPVRLIKVNADYSDAILGTWEGRCTSAGSVFDDGQEHRWEYRADGNFVYYMKNGESWTPVVETLEEYFVAGNLLCTRWVDNGVENREWWEISIDGDAMSWTALRQNDDGTTFTATFEMTKVQ